MKQHLNPSMIRLAKSTVTMIIIISIFLATCQSGQHAINVPGQPYEKLSEYQFFTGVLSDLNPNKKVLPYDLNSPLFSDYAYKSRFVWMPEGSSSKYTTDKVLEFPEKTVLIKNFYYLNDERDPSKGRRIIETRLLINNGDKWDAHPYIWNEEQTEAYLEVIGGIQKIDWINKQGEKQQINYIIPNKNQCKSCHVTDDKQIPIGPKARNLNKVYSYVDGQMNQLEKWASIGYLSGYIASEDHPKLAVWDDPSSGTLHQRAMAYLDINCGHCHNPSGSANTSGLHLVANAPTNMSLGVFKATVSAGAGTGGHTYSIVPGRPEESIMVYRMNSTNPGAMMPELGRSIVHEEGVDLITEWIKKLEVDPNYTQSSKLQ
jgi:uncharacterized repeat protein (TIGR03806 family)